MAKKRPHEQGVPFSESEDGELGSAASDLDGAGEPRAGEPRWLPPVLRMMAETQRELPNRLTTKPRAALATRKLEEFRGGRQTTTHQYRSWKKKVLINPKM